MQQTAIVGAGIAGSLLAFQLLRNGFQVDIYQPETEHATCSEVAAGMLAPTSELEHGSEQVFKLGLRSLELWPSIISELKQQSGVPLYIDQAGTLVLSHAQDEASLKQFYNSLYYSLGNQVQDYCQSVSVREKEADIVSFQKGYWLPHEAHINAPLTLNALHQYIKTQATWYNKQAENLLPHNVDGQHYDWVFDCRGLHAKYDIAQMHGVRGERILLHAPDVTLTHMVRLMHPRYRLYIVPRPDKHFVIGATEIESDDGSPMSVRSALELLTAAYSVHKGFSEARILDLATQVRPATWDHEPYIDSQSGLTRINGLYRHGYLLAPALIEEAMKQAQLSNDFIKQEAFL
ncbi:FAD-dependent oxidoreductase [Bermanella sp. R86510]|uniref:FAD-dependent oxidoreductase n=1 Tax=unclassified Bermanella TaxID=2627862 RepID=UPI0037C99CBF